MLAWHEKWAALHSEKMFKGKLRNVRKIQKLGRNQSKTLVQTQNHTGNCFTVQKYKFYLLALGRQSPCFLCRTAWAREASASRHQKWPVTIGGHVSWCITTGRRCGQTWRRLKINLHSVFRGPWWCLCARPDGALFTTVALFAFRSHSPSCLFFWVLYEPLVSPSCKRLMILFGRPLYLLL